MKPFEQIQNPRDLRKSLGLSQQAFWAAVGTTQSGGSRYECGREMPAAVSELVRLVHVHGIDLSQISKADLDVVALLKKQHPEIYKQLKKSAKSRKGA